MEIIINITIENKALIIYLFFCSDSGSFFRFNLFLLYKNQENIFNIKNKIKIKVPIVIINLPVNIINDIRKNIRILEIILDIKVNFFIF